MPARLKVSYEANGEHITLDLKGRTIDSAIRTKFGEKAVVVKNDGINVDEGDYGHVEKDGKGIGAIIRSAEEWAARVEPPSRQKRWDSAVSKMQGAIEDAQSALDDAEEARTEFADEKSDWDALPEEDQEANEEPEESDYQEFQDRLDMASGTFNEGVSEILELKEEYADWEANLPEGLQGGNSPVSEKLEQIEYLDINEVEWVIEDGDVSDAENEVSEIESAELPLGWGRD